EATQRCVRLRLCDYGKQTEAHTMKGRAHDLIRPGGLGLHLIRMAFDKVDYILKARGTELVMTKNLEKAA
ncbi:MAG TPA: ATP-binding protein, partial [Chthoniobacterales bacterium]|nr:ATP-binding protein [Chthoniobacterales bacterium]